MRPLFLTCLLVACGGGGARAPEVSLPLPAPSASATTSATLLGCTIVGTGERSREGEDPYPFRVYATEGAREPVFVIEHPEHAHVVWSHFPARAERGRARVGLGGQARVHYEGFADLYGRTFTATTRMDSVEDHLWSHAGAPIDMMSATSSGDVFASVRTQFKAPSRIVVHGNCANVIYEPSVARREPKGHRISAVSEAPVLRFFAAPGDARPFTTITPSSPLQLSVLERKGDGARVAGEQGDVGFDAWVLASDLREASGYGTMLSTRRAVPPSIRLDGPQKGRVSRDTQLYVSSDEGPMAVHGAIVERGGVIAYDPTQAAGELVPFDFEDRFIVAPEGGRLWIAKDVVSSMP